MVTIIVSNFGKVITEKVAAIDFSNKNCILKIKKYRFF